MPEKEPYRPSSKEVEVAESQMRDAEVTLSERRNKKFKDIGRSTKVDHMTIAEVARTLKTDPEYRIMEFSARGHTVKIENNVGSEQIYVDGSKVQDPEKSKALIDKYLTLLQAIEEKSLRSETFEDLKRIETEAAVDDLLS